MSNKKSYLQGEIRYAEGQTSVKNFLSSLATELVRTGWTEFRKKGSSSAFAFDENREIDLQETFKPQDIRLFKILANISYEVSGLSTGKITVIRGANNPNELAINLTLNGVDYVVTLELGDTEQDVAKKIHSAISALPDFKNSYIDSDNVSVVVVGENVPVYELDTDMDVMVYSSHDQLTFSTIKDGIPTGNIRVLSGANDNGDISIIINGGSPLVVSVNQGETSQAIATKIRNRIASEVGFENTSVLDSVITISGSQELTSVSVDTDVSSTDVTYTTSSVQGGFGTFTIMSTAISDGNITLTINGTDYTVAVFKGDTPVQIANKVQAYMSGMTGFSLTNVADNVVTVAGSTTVSTMVANTDIASSGIPLAFTTSGLNPIRKVGDIEIITPPSLNQTLTVNVNSDTFSIMINGTDSINTVGNKIVSALSTNPVYASSAYANGHVTVRSNIDVFSIYTSNDLPSEKPYIQSSIIPSGEQRGIIDYTKPASVNVNLQVNVNGSVYMIEMLETDTTESMAQKTADIIGASPLYADTVAEGNRVLVRGANSVDYLKVSSVEIPSQDYVVSGTTIRGVGDADSGTNLADAVEIKVRFIGEQFQQDAFLENVATTGDKRNILQLKSRPQGEVILYEDVINRVEDEVVHSRDRGLYYSIAKPVVSKAEGTHEVVVKRGTSISALSVVDKSEYEIDYFNGLIIFKVANNESDVVSISYTSCLGDRGDIISSDKYRVIDDKIIDITPTGELKNLNVVVVVNYFWDLVYPSSLGDIDINTDRIVLKTDIDVSSNRDKNYKKAQYWEIRHAGAKNSYLTGVECRIGSKLDGSETMLDTNNCSEWARWSWYDKRGFVQDGIEIHDWLPIDYKMNFTQEYLNIVIQGSPSFDSRDYRNYIISYGYIGSLKEYDNAVIEDRDYNFGMTVGGDSIPEEGNFSNRWGLRTGTGNTDIVMERTIDGSPFQAHQASFHTSPEFMDKYIIGNSKSTDSQHFSRIVVTHGTNRERGEMQSVLIGDRSSIEHNSELISSKDRFNDGGALLHKETGQPLNKCGKANLSDEKTWVAFNINAPYWFGNNSPNIFYGILIRKK